MADDVLDPGTEHGEATEDSMPIREIINLILDRPIVEILLFLSVSALPIGVLIAGFSLIESQRRRKRLREITDQLGALTRGRDRTKSASTSTAHMMRSTNIDATASTQRECL
jgi:hypothetical protein